MALRGVGNSCTSSVGDLDARIGQASDLGYTNEQKDEYRQDKSEFYEGLPSVFT